MLGDVWQSSSPSACSQKSAYVFRRDKPAFSILVSQIPHIGCPRAQFEDPFGLTEVSEEPLIYPEVASGSDGADCARRCEAMGFQHECLQSDEQGCVLDVTEWKESLQSGFAGTCMQRTGEAPARRFKSVCSRSLREGQKTMAQTFGGLEGSLLGACWTCWPPSGRY